MKQNELSPALGIWPFQADRITLMAIYHYNLRLLSIFAGVLREKNLFVCSFTKIIANYTSEESLINAVCDKHII